MALLSFPLRSGGSIVLQNRSAETAGWMAAMSRLTGCPEEETGEQEVSCRIALRNPADDPRLLRVFSMGTHSLYLDPEDQSFSVLINPARLEEWRNSAHAQSYTGYLAVIGAVMREMLRGKPICLIHGALLHSEKGNILFCGQSGIGKSTTSRRWITAGGTAPADDMSLLEFCDDGIRIHPLPTWSLCATEGMENLHYPFDPPLHLDHLFALGRGAEKEELRDAAPWEFFQAIYSACMFFLCGKVTRLPEEFQRRLIRQLQENALKLARAYPQKALLAHLDGNLAETLAEYL